MLHRVKYNLKEVIYLAFQLIIGASGCGKSRYLTEKLIAASVNDREGSYIVAVPEQFTMETQKNIVFNHPDHGVMNIDIVSFERLAYRIFEEQNVTLKPVLDDCGKLLILRKVIEENKDRLEIYSKNVNKVGFVVNMKSLISELLQYDISVEKLDELLEKCGNKKILGAKLKDISIIYTEFKKELGEDFLTSEEILKCLCTYIGSSNIIRKSTVVFDGYTGFTPIQYKVIELLMIHAKNVVVTVTMDTKENYRNISGEHELFYLSKETINKLYELADKNNIECKEDILMDDGVCRRFNNEPLRHLEKNVFRFKNAPYEGKTDDCISIFEAFNPHQEINYVVYRIKSLVKEGYRFKDIAVVSGDNAAYSKYISKIFEASGISTFIDDKKGVLGNPLIELIRTSLLVAHENFSYDSVFRMLKTKLTGIEDEAVDILENYVIACGIKGYSAYKKEWVKKYNSADEINLEYINSVRKGYMEKYEPLYRAITKRGATVSDIIKALYAYLDDIGVYDRLLAIKTEVGEKLLEKEFETIYDSVIDIFEKTVRLIGNQCIPPDELANILDTGFEQVRISIIPPIVDSVTVGDIERTRLSDIKVLFFVGVNDGIIPKASDEGGILSEFDRENMKAVGAGLAPTKRENIYIQKFYLYLNMTKPSQRLYMSYSKFDFEGKGIQKSYLIGNMLSMYPSLKVLRESDIDGLENYIYKAPSVYEKRIVPASYIEPSEAVGLYGKELYGSVSRIEKYISCAFAHFLQYGLELSERQCYEVTGADLGSLYHDVLRRVTLSIKDSEYTFSDIPDAKRSEMVREAVIITAEDYKNTIMFSSERNKYMLEKMTGIVDKTVWAIGRQLKKGNFNVESSELPFSPQRVGNDLMIKLSDGGSIELHGRIDRVDTCEDKDNIYVKVVDYKTYDEKLDFTDVYYGLNLQLMVYMKAALLIEQKRSEKSVIPAALFYNILKNPIVRDTDEPETELLKEMRPVGILNDDTRVIELLDNSIEKSSQAVPLTLKSDGTPDKNSGVFPYDVMERVPDYALNRIRKAGEEIMRGNVSVSPYQKGNKTSCEYCRYASICGFDYKEEDYGYRRLKKIDKETLEQEILCAGNTNAKNSSSLEIMDTEKEMSGGEHDA